MVGNTEKESSIIPMEINTSEILRMMLQMAKANITLRVVQNTLENSKMAKGQVMESTIIRMGTPWRVISSTTIGLMVEVYFAEKRGIIMKGKFIMG